MKKYQRGEIATVITLGAFLILSVSSLVSNLFLKNKIPINPKAQTTTSCGNRQGAQDATGACNTACCTANSDCPGTTETCGVPNWYCKSGFSCADNAPSKSTPLYIRACLGATCAWTWCDGRNYPLDECTSNVNSIGSGQNWCSSDTECQSRRPPNISGSYVGVTNCIVKGQRYSCDPDGNTVLSKGCLYQGKGGEIHTQCTQSNTSGCVFWCKGTDGNRYRCDDPKGLYDDSRCTGPPPPSVPVQHGGIISVAPTGPGTTPGVTPGTETIMFGGTIKYDSNIPQNDPRRKKADAYDYNLTVKENNQTLSQTQGTGRITVGGKQFPQDFEFAIPVTITSYDRSKNYLCSISIKDGAATVGGSAPIRCDKDNGASFDITMNLASTPIKVNFSVKGKLKNITYRFLPTIVSLPPLDANNFIYTLTITSTDSNETSSLTGTQTLQPNGATFTVKLPVSDFKRENLNKDFYYTCTLEIKENNNQLLISDSKSSCGANKTKDFGEISVLVDQTAPNIILTVKGKLLASPGSLNSWRGLNKDLEAKLILDDLDTGDYDQLTTNSVNDGGIYSAGVTVKNSVKLPRDINWAVKIIQKNTDLQIGTKSGSSFRGLTLNNQDITINMSRHVIDFNGGSNLGCNAKDFADVNDELGVQCKVYYLFQVPPIKLCINIACDIYVGLNSGDYTYDTGGKALIGTTWRVKIPYYYYGDYIQAIKFINAAGNSLDFSQIRNWSDSKPN